MKYKKEYNDLTKVSTETLRKLIKYELKPNVHTIAATLEFDRRLHILLENIIYV